MTTTDANPPMPTFRDDYVLQVVNADWLSQAVKPKQFINIDQSECILCEGCVPGLDPDDSSIFIIDDDVCTRCALCVDRCPTGVITLGKVFDNPPATGDVHGRTNNHGYAYGMRF